MALLNFLLLWYIFGITSVPFLSAADTVKVFAWL